MRKLMFPSRLYVSVASIFLLAAAALCVSSSGPPTVEQLKARLASAKVGDQPKICVQIAQQQLEESIKLYATGDSDKAQAGLADVVSFSESARDAAIQSHKHEKQTEIAVRGMARKLSDTLHTLTHDEQPPVQDAIQRLQRVRDDLLIAMFPKGAK